MSSRYVAFAVGATRYCLPIGEVRQIVRHENVTGVPQAPPYVEGVMNLRGEVVPVIDLRLRLGVSCEQPQRKSRVLIVESGGRSYGLHVDDVREIVEVDEEGVAASAVEAVAADARFVGGFARVGDGLLVVLDLRGLLAGTAGRT